MAISNADALAQLEQIKQQALGIQAQIPTATGYTTDTSKVENLGNGASLTLPNNVGDVPDLSGATSGASYWEKYLKNQSALADQARKDYEAKQAEVTSQSQSWLDKIGGKKTTQQTMEDYFAEIGVKPKEFYAEQEADLAAIKGLQEDYNAAVAQKENEMNMLEQRVMPQNILTAKLTKAEKDANVRLSLKAANINTAIGIMEAKNNNFAKAQDFVNRAVENYTADLKIEYENFQIFRETNKDILDSLDDQYKTALQGAENAAKMAYEQKTDMAKTIGNLILNAPGAGITLNDTLEDAYAKYEKYKISHPESSGAPETQGDYYWDTKTGTWKPISGGGDKGVPVELYTSNLQAEIDAGKTPQEALKNLLKTIYEDDVIELEQADIDALLAKAKALYSTKQGKSNITYPNKPLPITRPSASGKWWDSGLEKTLFQ